jgi:hypothetical protein
MPFYANAILLVVSALLTMLMLGHMNTHSRGFSFSRSLSRALRATLEMVQRLGRV